MPCRNVRASPEQLVRLPEFADDSEFAATQSQGHLVVRLIVAGDYDSSVFEKPHEFRIKRERSRQILNFGWAVPVLGTTGGAG